METALIPSNDALDNIIFLVSAVVVLCAVLCGVEQYDEWCAARRNSRTKRPPR